VYFDQKDEFVEVDRFIEEISMRYGIEVLYPAGSFKAGLQDLLDKSEVQCIFIGTRRIDPHGGNMEMLHLTDASWCVQRHCMHCAVRPPRVIRTRG